VISASKERLQMITIDFLTIIDCFNKFTTTAQENPWGGFILVVGIVCGTLAYMKQSD
jgi:hypothetical protein